MFSSVVLDHWIPTTTPAPVADGLRVVVDDTLPANRSLMVLELTDGGGFVTLTADQAARTGLVAGSAVTLADVRRGLEATGVSLHDPDHLFYLPLDEQAATRGEPTPTGTRPLDPTDSTDREAFAAFTATAPDDDLDEAFVELDHWRVVATSVGDRLVSAASAYPWAGSALADIGVLTLPDHQGRGMARRTVRAISALVLAAGHEPQYRCQLDNAPSVALARSAGFVPLGRWSVIDVD